MARQLSHGLAPVESVLPDKRELGGRKTKGNRRRVQRIQAEATSTPGNATKAHLQENVIRSHPVTTLPATATNHLPLDASAALCLIQKDEEQYLQEFLDYHLGIGFSEIIVLDNSDDFQLSSWQEVHPKVTVISTPGEPNKHNQLRAMKLCLGRARQGSHTWLAFLDIDERLILHQHENVVNFARDYCPRNHLAINWRIISFCGQETFVNLPVMQRFQCRHGGKYGLDATTKSFVYLPDVDVTSHLTSPHFLPLVNGAVHIDTDGYMVSNRNLNSRQPHDVASVYHYHTRSVEEFVAKRMRGATTGSAKKGNGEDSLRNAREKKDHRGLPIPTDNVHDSTAWKALLKVAPSYAKYENNPQFAQVRANWTCLDNARTQWNATAASAAARDANLSSNDADACSVDNTTKLTNLLMSTELGWSKQPPMWVQEICPEVVDHFDRFPSIKDFVVYENETMPWFTTDYVVRGVCTLKVAQTVASSIGVDLLLYAGAHIGSLVHGQPIPWDDDIDMAISACGWAKLRDRLRAGEEITCEKIHHSASLCSQVRHNALKLWVEYKGDPAVFKGQAKNRFKSPYVDLFAYVVSGKKVVEIQPWEVDIVHSGNWTKTKRPKHRYLEYAVQSFFPTVPQYFGGLVVLGPNETITRTRYDLNACVSSSVNHRLNRRLHSFVEEKFGSARLNCCELSKRFPFRRTSGRISNGGPNSIVPDVYRIMAERSRIKVQTTSMSSLM